MVFQLLSVMTTFSHDWSGVLLQLWTQLTYLIPGVAFLMGLFASSRRPLVPRELRSTPVILLAFAAFTGVPMIVAVIFIFLDKYGKMNGCNLDTFADNEWTMGQMLPMFMLIGLILPAFDIYFGNTCGTEITR